MYEVSEISINYNASQVVSLDSMIDALISSYYEVSAPEIMTVKVMKL